MNTFELDLEAVGVLLLVIGHIEVAERTEHRRRLRAHRTLRGEQHTSDDTDDDSGVLHDYTLLVVGPNAHRSVRREAVLERANVSARLVKSNRGATRVIGESAQFVDESVRPSD